MANNGWFSTRNVAAFAGGASAAFIASRILPPLVSQGVGSLRAARGQDPLKGLVDDHRRFLHLLSEMERSRGRGRMYRAQLLTRLKRGLAAHAMAEEDVIYPLLQEVAGAKAAAMRLYADHGAVKTHLYALERNLGNEAVFIERAAALRNLIADHARQEEEVEFPRLRRALDTDATTAMARHVRRERAMVL